MLISGLIAQDGRAALAETSRWAVTILAFFVGLQFIIGQSERRVIALIGVLALCGFFEASFGVVQSVLALGPSSFQLESGASRAFGTFGKPNSYAGFLEVVLFPTVWLGVHFVLQIPARFRAFREARLKGMLASRDERWQLLLTIVLAAAFLFLAGITLSGIVASLSRGAWLGVAVAAFVTAFLFHRLVRLSMVAVGAGLALLLLTGFGGVIPEDLRERVTTSTEEFRLFDASTITITSENFAAVERLAHWQAGWNMWEDHPLLGVGAGNFNERYDDYYVREGLRFSRGHAHNYYIHTLAETGLAGLVAYLTLIGSLGGLALWTVLKAPQGIERMVALGSLGTMTSVAVHNVFENLHVLNIGITMGLVWVLIIWAHLRWRSSDAGMSEEHVDR
jgi:O-antigen ligase